MYEGLPISIIRPERDIATMDADFTSATEKGMVAVYEYGQEVGREFVRTFRPRN
jgi:hypothetical protein